MYTLVAFRGIPIISKPSNLYLISNYQLIVPYFQRRYVWEEENWKQLFDNLCYEKDCFLGTVVFQQYPHDSETIGKSKRMIIDGQQRLTTLCILYKACTVVNPALAESLEILFSKGKSDLEERLTIMPSELDREDYLQIMMRTENSLMEEGDSKLKKAFNYFLNRLKTENGSAERIYEILCEEGSSQIFVLIDLGSNVNSQKIFDTLNKAGVLLSDSETIKNILFQKLMESKPGNCEHMRLTKTIYDHSWKNTFDRDESVHEFWKGSFTIGKSFERSRDDDLVHWAAIIEDIYDPEKHGLKDLCQVYREYTLNHTASETEELIGRICAYAELFRRYIVGVDKNIAYANQLKFDLLVITKLSGYSFMPYVLKILYTGEDVQDKLDQLTAYVVLARIYGTKFKNANKSVKLMINGSKDPLKYLKELIKDKKVSVEQLITSLRHVTDRELATVLLFSIEIYRRFATKLADLKELDYAFTWEHIMPQEWEDNWDIYSLDVYSGGVLIEDEAQANQIRSDAVNELGNFGLISGEINSSISNASFKVKIEGNGKNHGLRDLSDLRIVRHDVVREVYEKGLKWDERIISQRTKSLTLELLECFPLLGTLVPTEYISATQSTLDRDGSLIADLFKVKNFRETFTAATLKSYSVNGVEYYPKSSREFTVHLIKRLYPEYGDKIELLAASKEIAYLEPEYHEGYTTVSDKIYLNQIHIGMEENLKMIRKIYTRLEIADCEIIIRYLPNTKRMKKKD